MERRDLEDLLLETMDAVSRFRVGQREAVEAALDAGQLLSEAKGRLQHGGWGDWLDRVVLRPRTASTWMRLAALELTVDQVIERGGINAASRGRTKSASEADLTDLDKDLADAEREIGEAKAHYYAALNRRHLVLRALAKGKDLQGS